MQAIADHCVRSRDDEAALSIAQAVRRTWRSAAKIVPKSLQLPKVLPKAALKASSPKLERDPQVKIELTQANLEEAEKTARV